MRAERTLLPWLLAALAAGCLATPDLTPRPAGLTPAGGPAGQPTAVTIRGHGFFPRTVQSSGGGPATVDATHRAWLDDVALSDVAWVDEGTLRATVPAGALALGPHALTVENALGRRGTLAAAFTVIDPAALGATVRLTRGVASTGQVLSLQVSLANTGGSAVQGISLSVTVQGEGGATVGTLPAAVDVAAGGEAALEVPLTATSAGALTVSVVATGREAISGRVVEAAASAGALAVVERAALAAALALPAVLEAGSAFTVTMTVSNTGGAAALGVAPGPLTLVAGSTGVLASFTGPTPAAADVAGQGSATFRWSAQLQGPGSVQLTGAAAGADENDGGPVAAPPARSNVGSQRPEVSLAAADPLGDGTPVAALAVRGGELYVGPSRDGRSFWRLDPLTGMGGHTGVEIAVDLGSSPATNQAWRASPPATTFGAAGCAGGTTACGPSDESGRGALAAGHLSGAEWLLYAPTGALKAQSLYLASGVPGPLAFQTVDLSAVLPTTSMAPTAAAFAPGTTGGADRLYLAVTDKAAQKSPALVALATAPAAPWLDAADGVDAVELGVAAMPGLGGAAATSPSADPEPRLDAILHSRGSLYLASGGGVMRSTTAVPRSYLDHPGDWTLATPASWLLKASLPATTSAALTPADRAVPGLVRFGDCDQGACLFLARNVQGATPAVAPQLWACRPDRTSAESACDPLDWRLAVPNPTGDPLLSQLGVPTHGAVSVLLATGRYLYLGFDDAVNGAQLFRTAVAPTRLSDFKGRDGCSAGAAGCVGLGGGGFGDPARTRFLDARALDAGGQTTVYVAAGDASGPLQLFALPE